ncbi:unnamed protein product, partial [Medioppia subpectinata]
VVLSISDVNHTYRVLPLHFNVCTAYVNTCRGAVRCCTSDVSQVKINEMKMQAYFEVKNSRDFTGKVVLVTGSSSGIGEGIVKLFAILGANVVVTGRNETEIQRVAKEVLELSPNKLKPLQVSADLTKTDDIKKLIDETIKTFGKLDVLVNNSGIVPNLDIHDKNVMEEWDKVMNIDLRAVVEVIHSAVPHLEASKGVIINISSGAAGLNMLTRVLALQLAPKGVRVNTVSPGVTKVPAMPAGREQVYEPYIPLRSVDVIQSRNFTDKVVLITGSSSGIGEGIAKLFAVLGAKVVVTGRKEADVHKVALELEKLSPYKIKPLEVAADLTKSEDINRLVEQTIKTFGKLDVLVNNAGAGKATLIGDPDLLKSWDFTFGIDLRAVVELTHAAVPYLEKTNGTIIDTSSIAATYPGSSAYNCAKAGLNMLAEVLALELGPKGIRVNTISPGFTEVDTHSLPPDVQKLIVKQTPLRRVGQPLDMAKAVAFLASTDAHSGIGEGIAKLFAVLGAKVVVTGRKEADVHKVALELEKLSPYKIKPLEVVADLTKSEDITRLVDQTIKTFGKLDVLVNNAGGGASTYIWDSGLLAAWDQIFNINLRGVVELIHTTVPHLEKTNGTIIDTSSIAGIAPFSDMVAYSSAKAALTMLAKVLALELGPKGIRVNTLSAKAALNMLAKVLALELGPKGIRVNTISPGYTEVESHLLPPDFRKIIEKQTPLKHVIQSRNFTDKVVLVTGSSSGIGEGIVKLFAVLGAKVVVTARKVADVHRVALELEKLSPYKIKPLEVAADLTKPEDINRLVEQTIKTFGKLDVLVNNAGIGLATFIKDTGLMATWDQVFNVDLRAVIELTHSAVPYLEKTNGTIIDTSSILDTAPRLSAMAYNCAKAALTMLAKVLALELGPKGIRVNTISPGFTEVESHLFPPDFKKLVEKRTPLKLILVTGSSSGIGAEITKLFSILGARVVVTGRKAPEVEKVAKEVQELSPKQLKPLQVVADLTKTEDLNRLLDETIKTFGKLDVLVNNAGIYFNTTIGDANLLTKWDQIFAIDLRAVVQLIQQSVPHLKKTNGTIIDISAIEGTRPGIVKLFAILGAKVVVTGRNATEIAKVAQEVQLLSPEGLKPLQVVADLGKSDDINKLISQTISTFGKLDVLVNNAGVYPMSPIDDTNFMKTFDQVFNIDLRAIVETIQISVPYMAKTNGTIINISSIAALHPAALDMLTRVLALELGPRGIRVNTINPGTIQVPHMDMSVDLIKKMVKNIINLTPLERLGQPLDVAKGVVFLASSDADFITGANIVVDGGFGFNDHAEASVYHHILT